MQLVDIMFFASYHRGGLSTDVLAQVTRQSHRGVLPFILFGDFNDEPAAFSQIDWLDAMSASIVDPGQRMCSAGAGRKIDYCIVSNSLLPIVNMLEVSWQVPFSPQTALTLWLSRNPKLLVDWHARRPTPLPKTFISLLAERSEQEHEIAWNSIEVDKIQQVLKSQGIEDESARSSFSQDLSKWAARLELWTGQLTGIVTEDVASAAKSFGRCQPVRYIRTPATPKR